MMKVRKRMFVAVVLSALVVPLAGCEKKGPAERAGRNIDNAAEKAGRQIEKAGEAIQDAAKGKK